MAKKEKESYISKLKEEFKSVKTEDDFIYEIKTNTPVDFIIPRIPVGRITTLFGPESSGKTTYAMHLAKAFQDKGGYVFWVDIENSFSETYAKTIGLSTDNDKFILIKDTENEQLTIERVFEITENILKDFSSNEVEPVPSILIWDSIAATPSEAEVQASFDSKPVAASAQALSFGLKKLAPFLGKSPNLAIVIITQVRSVMNTSWGGPDYDMYGGRSLRHYQSLSVEFRKRHEDREENSIVTEVIIRKSKFSDVLFGKSIRIVITHGVGINVNRSLFELAKELKVVTSSGGWWKFSNLVPQGLITPEEIKKSYRQDEIAEVLKKPEFMELLRDLLFQK